MRTWMRTAIVGIFAVGMMALAGCGPNKPCMDSCGSDSDCGVGLVCLDTAGSGMICLPEECRACFNNGSSCVDNPSQDQNNTTVCTYTGCD